MRSRLLATIIFSCLVALFVGSLSALTAGIPDRNFEKTISCCVKVTSFQVTQNAKESRSNQVSVAIEFRDEFQDIVLQDGLLAGTGKVVLIKTNGQQLLSVPYKLNGFALACDPDPRHPYRAYIYTIDLPSTAAQASISKGEPIQGVLSFDIYDHEYQIPLPETLVDVAD